MGNIRRLVRLSLVVIACVVGWACTASSLAFDHTEYELMYHQSGRITDGFYYGAHGQKKRVKNVTDALSVFTKGPLIYFVEFSSVTVFRPSEGTWAFLRYDISPVRENIDGTKVVDFSRTFPAPELAVWGIADAEVVRRWGRAVESPQTLEAFLKAGEKLPGRLGPQLRGKLIPIDPKLTVLKNVEVYLSTTTAIQAVPGIEATRIDMTVAE